MPQMSPMNWIFIIITLIFIISVFMSNMPMYTIKLNNKILMMKQQNKMKW